MGTVTYSGADLGFSWQIRPDLDLKGSYTHLRAQDENLGKRLTAQARHKAAAEIYWRPVQDFSAILKADHIGSVFADRDNTTKYPGRTLYGLRAEYVWGDYGFFLEADNLLDKDYLYVDGLLAPPRTWLIGLSRNF